MEMNKNEIINLCTEWVEKDEKRVAVVILAEPVEGRDDKVAQSSLVHGDTFRIANVLGEKFSRSEDLTAAVRNAAAIAICIKMDRMKNEREDLKDKEQ